MMVEKMLKMAWPLERVCYGVITLILFPGAHGLNTAYDWINIYTLWEYLKGWLLTENER